MRRACIDIGSNTTRLLVADCDGNEGLVERRQERAFTMLGRAIDASGAIPVAKLAEVLQAVAMQYAIARELGAEQVRCVATAGVRRASNGATLVRLIRDACPGLEPEILSGAEEARLAFIGAAWGTGAGAEHALGVVDAGGGSSELVIGDAPASVRWWVSLPLGSGDVTHRWLPSDPPTESELDDALSRTRAAFAEVGRPPAVRRMIAVGGSATSLRLLAGPTLDLEALDRLLASAQRHSAVEFARSFGIDVQRSRLLAGGLLILRVVSELFGVPLEIGRGGLREGLLLDQHRGVC
ncbi:MAG: exopolyphosphatase [Acidobacteriota bacterium]|nr:exopolyphosphatase [Acidobacteriota bacterium]